MGTGPRGWGCYVPALAVLFWSASWLWAAEYAVRGQISPAGAASQGLTVELSDSSQPHPAFRAFPDYSGQFRFDGVSAGDYELRVVSRPGAIVFRKTVSIRSSSTDLSVELPGNGSA